MSVNATTVKPLCYKDYFEYHVSVMIWKIFPPVFIVLGTIGNTLSIVVLLKKRMRESTVSIYLVVLAVVDILVLYTGLLRQWIRYMTDTDIRTLSETSCKLHIWTVYFTLDYSVWLLIAVTIERFIFVWFPHKVKTYCTHKSAYIVIFGIAVVLLVINSHFLYGLGDVVASDNGTVVLTRCTSLWDDYGVFQERIWPWIDLCLYFLIPFIILIFANISIIYKVFLSGRMARRVNPVDGTIRVRTNKLSSMTVMLLVLNVVFFVCTVPISVYLIGEPYWYVGISKHQEAVMMLWWAICNALMYCNHTINFLMYTSSGSRFRQTLRDLFRGNRSLRVRDSITLLRSAVGQTDTNVFIVTMETQNNLKPRSVNGRKTSDD